MVLEMWLQAQPLMASDEDALHMNASFFARPLYVPEPRIMSMRFLLITFFEFQNHLLVHNIPVFEYGRNR